MGLHNLRRIAFGICLAGATSGLRAQSPGADGNPSGVRLLPPVNLVRHTAPVSRTADWSTDALVAEVLARNPSLAQMVAAQQAAAAKYPQVTSLDDPMFGVSSAPGAWGNNTVNGGYRIEVSQKIPFHGKRALRGENALAEARATEGDLDDVRLQLIESAKTAFYDYYLITRALEINADSVKLLKDFRDNADSRYRTGLVTQQDVLQADVEIGRQRERLIDLEQLRLSTIARLNTLMHLSPDATLPSAPSRLPSPPAVPEPISLRTLAVSRRPDLQAIAQRIAAEEANVALARKEYLPDFEVAAAYDTFWQENPLRAQVGIRMNLPTRLGKRGAAVAEALARLAQKKAELDRQIDQINFQVHEAHSQVRKGERAIQLYDETILPAAKANVVAAQSAYATGKIPFLSLIEAQRNLVSLRDRQVEILVETYRKRATLERIVGGPIP